MINLSQRQVWLTLSGIVLLGAFLRFYHLSAESLWNDEVVSWVQSDRPNLRDVFKVLQYSIHPPGHNVILYFLIKHVGDSEVILRLPSVIGGIISIVAIFLVGRELYSEREGLIASLILSVVWAPIYFSQEARAYSLLMAFTLLATYFWLRWVTILKQGKEPSIGLLLAYVMVAIVSAYLHYFGLFLIALQGIGATLLLFPNKLATVYTFATYFPIVVAYVPWVPVMGQNLKRTNTWIPEPTEGTFLDFFKFLFNRSNDLLLLAVIFYIFLLIWTVYTFRKDKDRRVVGKLPFSSGIFLVIWLLLPMGIVYVRSLSAVPILTNRNLIISLPAAYILLARAITQLPVQRWIQWLVAGGITAVFLYHLIFVMDYYSRPDKPEVREVVQYVLDREDVPATAVIIGNHRDFLYNYYFEQNHSTQMVDIVANRADQIPLVEALLEERQPTYVWLLSGRARLPEAAFRDYLREKLILVEHKQFFQSDVWLYRSRESDRTLQSDNDAS